jgi:hypothetical protein
MCFGVAGMTTPYASGMESRGRRLAATGAVLVALPLAGCGGGSDGGGGGAQKPPPVAQPQSFPSPAGKTISQIRDGLGPGPVLAPAVSILTPGTNRFSFGLFDRARRQISQAPTALYISPVGSSKVEGPIPARDYPLDVNARFRSKTVSSDPNAAASVYVASLKLPRAGNYEVLAVAKLDDRLVAAAPISMPVIPTAKDPVPEVGSTAPKVHTETFAQDHGDVTNIDTRTPPSDMHKVDFATVAGKRPVVLVFATPALCQSRVCGPVVDMVYQVEAEHRGQVEFIHQEIYKDNDPSKGFRTPVNQFRLPTEPWVFAIDRKGKIAYRLEGAAAVPDIEAAFRAAVKR